MTTGDPAEPRELVGRMVRQIWVEWAREQPYAKPEWLDPWEQLDDGQREVDMRIGEALFEAGRKAGSDHEVIEGLTREVRIAERAREQIEATLDRVLGARSEDGAGQGMAADVELLAERHEQAKADLKRLTEAARFDRESERLAREAAEAKAQGLERERDRLQEALAGRQQAEDGTPAGEIRACAQRLIEWCNDREASPTIAGYVVADLVKVMEQMRNDTR